MVGGGPPTGSIIGQVDVVHGGGAPPGSTIGQVVVVSGGEGDTLPRSSS